MPTPTEVRDLLVKHLNSNPLPGQEGRADAIDGETAIGLEINDELFFLSIQEA